jgi:hypothetical protein
MSDVIRLLTSFSPEALQTLLVVRAMADAKGRVNHELAVIAEMLGVTPSTLRRRLTSLDKYVKFENGRITTLPLGDDAVTHMFRTFDGTNAEPTVEPHHVIERWSFKYAERYGVRYVWASSGDKKRWFATRALATRFVAQYGENALAVIDAIIDNYDALWRTSDYPRPTFGQLSWIGEKAAPLVTMRGDTKREDDDYDSLDGV